MKYWIIGGYDSFEKIFEKKVKAGLFTEKQMEELIKALAAKAGFNFNEIIGAYARKNSRIRNELLVVHKSFKPYSLICGDNPHFITRVIDE